MLAFAALGDEPRGAAPDREERVLHGVLGERLVAQHAQREPVGDAAVAVVELGERNLVGARGQRDDGFVGEMGKRTRHDRRGASSLIRAAGSNRFDSAAAASGGVATTVSRAVMPS